MANTSTNSITSLSQDWGYDPLQEKPFSGAAVQQFIKSYLGAVSKAAYFDPSTNTMYWFASEEDKTAFVADPTLTNLVLFSTTMSFSSELFRILLTNNNNTTNINIATNETEVILSIDFDVQTKSMTETSWRSTGQGVYISVQVDKGAYGNYTTIMNPTFYQAETTFEMNVRNDIIVGQNRVKVNFVSENDNTIVASITYSITMTEMFIESMNNEWYVPIVETGDIDNYKLGGFRIVGAISKTLHLDIYSGTTKLLQFSKALGTTTYNSVPYYYTRDAGLDLSDLETGVYIVSAYLTSGSLTSAPVNYTIMYIATGDETTAQLVAINDVADVVYNYTTSTLFKYAIYNKGTLSGSPHIVVKEITGTTPNVIVNTTINDVSTAAEHTYEVALEWLTEQALDLYIQGEITFGNEQIARAILDNSATFPPTYGYEFYLNAASRSNSDTNRLKIVNTVNNTEYTPTWTRMIWIDGVDGWTTDDINRQCLYLPAGSYVELPYSQYKIINGDNITVEMCYKVSNVTNYDETILSVANDLSSDGFQGLRIKPTNIVLHSSADTSSTNDLSRGTNVMDENVIHFVFTIYPNYQGNSNQNLVTGYVNGCKNFQFSYVTGTIWNTNGNLKIGSLKSDISLYFIRVYRSVLSDAAVQANYINSLKDISARTDLAELLQSVIDVETNTDISYEQVKNNDYNFFVIEMLNNASLPAKSNGWSKDTPAVRSNLEMHYGKNPSWDWKINDVETSGQGTTSMNYYRWNLRWRIDKTSTPINKECVVQYLESRQKISGSYVYNWTTGSSSKKIKFDGITDSKPNHPEVMRITAKINAASSMQSHKIGATRAFTELHDAVGLSNEAQNFAYENSKPKPTVAVYQYPAFGFQKIGDVYYFIGLFTIGPDKGDKGTFGYNIDDSIKNELITLEGTDHVRKMAQFQYPWNNDVAYLYTNECINIIKGTNNYDNGWEVGNCHGLSTDKSTDEAAIRTVLDDEFKPAYELAWKNSTLIVPIALNDSVYGGTNAAAVLANINASPSTIADFQARLTANNRMAYSNVQFWIEGEYQLYYYDIKTSQYVADINLVTQNGSPEGSTLDEKNEWFKTQRRTRFKANAESYWDIDDALYHMAYCILFGAMDNFAKNTYPYKMATFANGGRWKWRQDDLDSILGIGNAGFDNMPNWMEFTDSKNGSVYFAGSTSVFWNLIYECYYDDYVSTVTSSSTRGFITMGKDIMNGMASLASGANIYESAVNYIKTRFWDNAQNYFPQSAYNADARYKYEDAWLETDPNKQQTTVLPLTQSLGNHFSAEEYWVRKRVIYMMSLFKVGAFGSPSDASLGQISFRPLSLPSVTLTPNTKLYPAYADGQTFVTTARTDEGTPHTFNGPFSPDGQSTSYINAVDCLENVGDLKDLHLGEGYIQTLQVSGKKLLTFKIGDENKQYVITPAVYYTQSECNIHNASLQGAFQSGDQLSAEKATLVNSVLGTEYQDGDTISEADANAYNATLEGAISTSDIKTPAVMGDNVTTNVPGLTFSNTKCLETIDARYAASILGILDLSSCPRIHEVYLKDTSISQVKFKSGTKVEKIQLPDATTAISLRNLKLLTDANLTLPTDLTGITQIQIERCAVDCMQILYDIYNTDNNSLQFFNVATDEPHTADLSFLDSLVLITQGKDKDGNPANEGEGYHGMSSDGATLPNANPIIDGVFLMSSGFYQQDMDALSLTNIEPYTPDPTKNIGLAPFFSALYIVYDPLRVYYRFIDPEVNRVVANWAGEGTGTTIEQIQSVSTLPINVFSGITDIIDFSDFAVFTGLRTISGGVQATPTGAFVGCTNLKKIVLPNGLTSIGQYTFYNLPNLEEVIIPSTVTSIGRGAFYNIPVKNMDIPCTVQLQICKSNDSNINSARGILGNYTGDIIFRGSISNSGYHYNTLKFNHIYVYGNLSGTGYYTIQTNGVIRVKGTIDIRTNAGNVIYSGSCPFCEAMTDITNASGNIKNLTSLVPLLHLGKNAIITSAPGKVVNYSALQKCYVGDGSSKQNDESTLALYLADTNWATYSAKLATWYDYNGEYKWYYVTDNLTNCTNTNPVDWPFITRKESYETTIVANEGYILSSVQVLMYQCQDNTATPANPTDITSQAYDSSTGKITINEVIGNVEIIATAS